MTEDDLDHLFAAARTAPERPPAALAARVMADAAAVLQERSEPAHIARPRPGLWSALQSVFGGSGVLAGMATATVAGFWLGFAQPAQLDAMSALLTGSSAEIDLMPGIDALLDEAP